MKKPIILLAILTLLLSSTIPIFGITTETGVEWNPDFDSSGVVLDEPFEGYLYDPAVVHGETLVIATPSDPPEQHQFNAGASASYEFLDPMSDYLVRTDPVTGGPVPWIAESWDLSEDHLTYTIHLAKGVKFHDGTELTSEDVKWCFDFVMENQFTRMSDVWDVLDPENPTEIVDDYTIKFHLKEPFVPFPQETLTTVAIVPKHVWEVIAADPDFDWFTYVPTLEEQVGCGPFKLIEYEANSHFKFEAFEDYWHGKPYVDYMLRPIITSGDAELLAVKRGDVDVFTGFLASEAIPGLLREEGIGLFLYNNPYFYHWGMNTAIWPFNEKEFRYACAYSVDKQDLVATLLLGYGIPGPVGVEAPFYSYWFNEDTPETYTFNLTKAAEILDDLGWVDTDEDGIREGVGEHAGEPIAFDIGPPIYDPVRVRAAELIAENLQQIGVDATVQYMEWATLWGKIIQPLDSPSKIDSWLLGSSESIDPQWLKTRLHSTSIPNPNYYGFVNAEFDQLAEAQGQQFDVDERRASVFRMQEILAEEIPLVVMYFRQSPSVYRTDKLTGWVDDFDAGRGNFWDYVNVRPKVSLKAMSISVVNTPAPEVEIGDTITVGIKYIGPSGEEITDAEVTALVTGDPTSYVLAHAGAGTYRTTFDTTGWLEGDYTLRIDATAVGYNELLTTFAVDVAEPAPELPPEEPSFWESYGATVTGVVVVLAVVAIVFVYRSAKK
ncbi:ABC transporter substrate-binding protein [Candidatus Bathyarchaeota archaeon]|nr:ABC transporter substrate-binding protein [Candidatus Bathyarchaeota archaeon]